MRNLMVISASLALLTACNNGDPADEDGLTVQLQLDGVTEAAPVRLFVQTDTGAHVIDSSAMANGMAALSGNIDQPQALYVQIEGRRQPIMLYGHSGKMTISGDLNVNPPVFTYTGGPYSNSLNALQDIEMTFGQQYMNLGDQWELAVQAGDTARQSAIRADFEVAQKKRFADARELAKESGAYGAWIALRYFSNEEVEVLDSIYQAVASGSPESPDVIALNDRIETLNRVAIGQPMVDFAQPDTSGNIISLSDNLEKYTLIDFWAAWCGPCRQENPNLVAAYEKYKDRGFTVIGVSLDDSRQDWVRAINDDNLQWPQMSDLKQWANEGAKMYGVQAIPTNVVVDENGIIAAKDLRGPELHKWLEERL